MINKLLIIGWFGYNNIGDELILHSLLSYLREKDLEILVVSANPQQTKKIHEIEAINRLCALKRIRHAKKVVFSGGQIFNDRRIRTIPLWSFVVQLIHLVNNEAQIILLNQGFESTNVILYKILRSTLIKSKIISVRDSASYHLIKAMNLNLPFFFGPDLLFSLDVKDIMKESKCSNKSHLHTIGINLRPSYWWNNKTEADKYHNILASTLDMLIKELKVNIIFLPFRLPGKEPYNDLDFTRSVVSKMKNKDKTKIFICPLDGSLLRNLINCFNRFDLFIGTALHSLILSCKLNVPFLAFPYQKKCKLFLNDIGLSDLIIKPEETLDSNLLYSKILNTFLSRNEIRDILCSKERTLFENSKKSHIDTLIMN